MKSICIIAGEPSGDLYAAEVIKHIFSENLEVDIFGIGGDNMIKNNFRAIYHINQLSFMGFVEVAKNIYTIKEIFKETVNQIKIKNPDVLVLIDFPGFNLRLIKKAYKFCKRIIYYITPQLWAWGKRRVNVLKKYVNELLVIFPFEKEFYEKENIKVTFVGHPLVEILNKKEYLSKNEFFNKYNYNLDKKLIAIYPGSRLQEIDKHLDLIEDVIKKINNNFDVNIGIAISPLIDRKTFIPFTKFNNVSLIEKDRHNLLNYSDFAIVKSGTSTIETALFNIPMVIFYKTSWLNYYIGRCFVKIDSFGMVNIIAKKKIVPELLQREANSDNILKWCEKFLKDMNLTIKVKNELRLIKETLAGDGVAERVSKIILYGNPL